MEEERHGGQRIRETVFGDVPDDDDDLDAAEQEALETELIDDASAAQTMAELEAEVLVLQALVQQAQKVVASGNDRKCVRKCQPGDDCHPHADLQLDAFVYAVCLTNRIGHRVCCPDDFGYDVAVSKPGCDGQLDAECNELSSRHWLSDGVACQHGDANYERHRVAFELSGRIGLPNILKQPGPDGLSQPGPIAIDYDDVERHAGCHAVPGCQRKPHANVVTDADGVSDAKPSDNTEQGRDRNGVARVDSIAIDVAARYTHTDA
jgi:hypothetical protein